MDSYLGGTTQLSPSADEIKDIKNILEASSKEVRDIDAEIHVLQGKKSKISDHVERLQALISPIRRFDRDILEQIFLACLPRDRNPCMSAMEAPTLLTHICSSWRTIAHFTPQLWAAIHIVLPSVCPESSLSDIFKYPSGLEDLVETKLNRRWAAARVWLDRSHPLPICISVYQSPEVHQKHNIKPYGYDFAVKRDQQLHLSFLNNIFSYSNYLYEVDVYLSARLLNSLFKSGVLTAQRMVMMKKVHITCRTIENWNDPDTIIKWENIVGILSSRLISVTFCGIKVYRSDLFQVPLNTWEHLIEMNLDARTMMNNVTSAEFAYSVIRYCHSLQTLKIDITPGNRYFMEDNDYNNSWNDSGRPTIDLPHLTSLLLVTHISREALGFVKCLYMPSLKELNLQLTPYFHVNRSNTTLQVLGQELITTLLRDCGDNLQSLELHTPSSATSSGNMQNLRLTPNLKCLKFSWSFPMVDRWSLSREASLKPSTSEFTISNDLLSILSPTGKDYLDVICPKLEILECDGRIPTSVSSRALKKFMEARRHAHVVDQRIATLQRLCLYVDEPEPREEIKKDIQSLVEGSSIHFRKAVKVQFSPWEGFKQ